MDKLRAYARRELVFLALGTMDVCVIAPLFAGVLQPIVPMKPLFVLLVLLGTVLAVHYLARVALELELDPNLRLGAMGLGMVISGFVIVHRILHAQTGFLNPAWVIDVARGLRREIFSPDMLLFLSVLFLWWRGLVLAQRRIDSESVAFRFRLGVVLLAITTGVGGSMVSWPHERFVFLFFFASLLGIAVARAEEVGRQYGGRQSPFGLGWLTTLVIASLGVLLLAAGLASLLTGENIGRVLSPVLHVLRFVLLILIYVLAWLAQFLIKPLLALFRRLDIGPALEEAFERVSPPQPPEWETQPRDPFLTLEQQATIRVAGAVGVALVVLLLVAFSLHRLRAKSRKLSDEERESVWEGAQLRRGLRDLMRRGRERLDGAAEALGRSRLGRIFAALTIRRIYAHLGALAAERGYPRAIDETPYDYVPTLKRAFPGNHEDVMEITESYVAVHYGELPERAEDLATVRSAWERIQEAASKRARIPSSTQ